MTTLPASLEKFFVFCPRLGPREETEHEKVLFYYPADASNNQQQSDIGITEAFVNFAKTFSDVPCDSVHTEKHRKAIIEPEEGIWFVLDIRNACTVKNNKEIEWHGDELDDVGLKTLVKQMYKIFTFFNGTCEQVLAEKSAEELRNKLKSTLLQYLPLINLDHVDIFTSLDGIKFHPVNKNIYLKIQSFVNGIEHSFEQIHYTCFLFKDSLIWSGLEQDDIKILIKFLNDNKPRLDGRTEFVTGPDDLNMKNAKINAPKVFVGDASKNKLAAYHLIIYQLMGITCVYLIDVAAPITPQFFHQLRGVIKPQIEFLAPIIENNYTPGGEQNYKYIYFNQMNLAMKTSLLSPMNNPKVNKVLTQMHSDFEAATDGLSEVIVRTAEDTWIVGKKSDQRELFVIFDQKNANLMDINSKCSYIPIPKKSQI
jgi:hypothetical protein